ncbi:MAG: ABC transporter permease [Lachnospiraceae bacterium]|nr:ABC transporter permease [Lachnospiraceae bacterium]
MKNILTIIKKQLKDTLKNKTVLIQFVLFPIITLVMENAVHIESMPEHFFSKLFSVMYIGMAPLSVAASIIAEEKEKNTLRVLVMADIKPHQYLIGVGIYIWMICMIGAGVIATGLDPKDIPFYLLVMGVGFLISILAGACVGVCARDQMMATSLYMPVMMACSFMPMLAMFNEKIKSVAGIFYTQQLRELLDRMSFEGMETRGAAILMVNMLLVIVLFFVMFKRKGLE